GDPQTTPAVAEASVPGLAAGTDAPVSFVFDTTGHAGNRTLYVVADAAGGGQEAREDDNATLPALPGPGLVANVTMGPAALTVSPNPPQEGETVTITAVVRNTGQRAAAPSVLAVFDGNPRFSGRLIGQANVPGIAIGGSASVNISWNTAGARGSHTLFIDVD